jgi:hypothetical protein
MAEDCARGERLGWQEFVRDYAPIARTLLGQYFPTLAPDADPHITAVFQRARAGEGAWFRQLLFSNEREFLMAFHDLVFAYAREVARVPVPELSLDQVRGVMQDRPLVEREMLWMFIKGYDAPRVAEIMMHAEATVQAVQDAATQPLAQALPAAGDALSLYARVLIEQAEKTAGEQCLPLKTFNNLINGQISWRDRELAEQHIAGCFRCLERFTAFQEMIRIRKDAPPLRQPAIDSILAQLNLAAERRKGLLGKLLAG